MKVYLFGNEDVSEDNVTFTIAEKIKTEYKTVNFITIKPNEDLPFENEKKVVIMDVVVGLETVTLIEEKDLAKLVLPPRSTVHDFDLGFQLKYLKKLGKLGEVKIIGIPMMKEIDYLRIHSILRKLVEQDIQGS